MTPRTIKLIMHDARELRQEVRVLREALALRDAQVRYLEAKLRKLAQSTLPPLGANPAHLIERPALLKPQAG